jgi:hypothetical protein
VINPRDRFNGNLMDATTIQLASMVVHLVEFIHSKEPTDLRAANGILTSPDVAEALEPGELIPVTRNGKSVAEMMCELTG